MRPGAGIQRFDAATARDPHAATLLDTVVRLPDGRIFRGELPAARHRSIHLGLLHQHTRGYFEIAHGVRPPGGRTSWNSRRFKDSYRLGGNAGEPGWLNDALRHVSNLCMTPRREIAIGPGVRREPNGLKASVVHSRWLWLDVDEPEYLHRLHGFLERHPAHLRVESGGSGGEHAYWQLADPQTAVEHDPVTGEPIEWIERAHARLMEDIGVRVNTGTRMRLRGVDPICKDRSRVMRLSGTINYKTGRHARIISADLGLEPYTLDQLVGHLPDPVTASPSRHRFQAHAPGSSEDPYKRISALDYFERFTGKTPDRSGRVSCPMPDHEDRNPSCSIVGENSFCWRCHGCDASGAIYDLASLLIGGPIGPALRRESFRAAHDYVVARYGDLR